MLFYAFLYPLCPVQCFVHIGPGQFLLLGLVKTVTMQNLEQDYGRKMEKLYFGCVGSYSNTEESKQFMKEGRMFILSGLDSWHDHSFLGDTMWVLFEMLPLQTRWGFLFILNFIY